MEVCGGGLNTYVSFRVTNSESLSSRVLIDALLIHWSCLRKDFVLQNRENSHDLHHDAPKPCRKRFPSECFCGFVPQRHKKKIGKNVSKCWIRSELYMRMEQYMGGSR